MAKYYFTDYARHCLSFYCKYPNLEVFESKIDEFNYICAKEVVSKLKPCEKEIIMAIFRERTVLHNSIKKICDDRNLEENEVWVLVKRVDKMIAETRELINRAR